MSLLLESAEPLRPHCRLQDRETDGETGPPITLHDRASLTSGVLLAHGSHSIIQSSDAINIYYGPVSCDIMYKIQV